MLFRPLVYFLLIPEKLGFLVFELEANMKQQNGKRKELVKVKRKTKRQ